MNKLLFSVLAVATLSLATGNVFAAKKDKDVETTTHEYRCGHCKARKEHPKAPCKTHGCAGSHVTCVKDVVVEEEFEQACEETTTFSCPEGTKRVEQGEGKAPKCEKEVVTVKTHTVSPCKHTVTECKNACPSGTVMKPGSEHSGKPHNPKHKKAKIVKEIAPENAPNEII